MFFEALIPITLFVGSFVMAISITYITRTATHRERMAMIEKGMDPNNSDKKGKKRTHKKKSYRALKFGITAVAMGMGLFVANILESIGFDEIIYFAMLLLFGGAALVLYYLYVEKNMKEEEENNRFLKDFEERDRDEDLV